MRCEPLFKIPEELLPEVGGKVGVLRQGHGIRILIDGGTAFPRQPVVERVAIRPHSG